MRARWNWLVIAATALAGGCDSAAAYRAVVQEQIAAYEEVERILAGVSDVASMQAAAPKLSERAEAIEATVRKAKRLGRPDPQLLEKLRPDFENLVAARGRYDQEVRRIVALPGGTEFLTKLNIAGSERTGAP